MTELLVASTLAGVLLGFVAGWLYARHRQTLRDRERAVEVLSGGPLPEWELDARRLEAKAVRTNLYSWAYNKNSDAQDLRTAADIVRDRGRRRDAEWKRG